MPYATAVQPPWEAILISAMSVVIYISVIIVVETAIVLNVRVSSGKPGWRPARPIYWLYLTSM
jgi:hypothetical protein